MNENSGLVYFVGSKKHKVVKIGVTQDTNVEKRIVALQTSSPFKLELFGFFNCTANCFLVEKEMHKIFSLYRLEGEWFELQGFLELFLLQSFATNKEQHIRKYKQNCENSWFVPDAKIDYIRQCANEYRKSDKNKSVLFGLEQMIKQVMFRNAKLESSFDAINAMLIKINEIIEENDPHYLRNSKDMSIEYELINNNYGFEAKLEAARYLRDKENFIFDNFWGNGYMPTEEPSKDNLLKDVA